MHPPKSAKRSTFSHKVGQKLGFCRRVRGVRFKKVHFLGPKGPLFGVLHPPKSILATGLTPLFPSSIHSPWIFPPWSLPLYKIERKANEVVACLQINCYSCQVTSVHLTINPIKNNMIIDTPGYILMVQKI